MVASLQNGVWVIANSPGREQAMRALQKAMTVVEGRLQKYDLKGFVVKTRVLVLWKCVGY